MSDDRPWSEIARGEITHKEITEVEEILPLGEVEGPTVGATMAVEAGPEAGRMLYVGSLGGVLGRSDDAGFTFSDKAISRAHARIDLRGRHFFIRDLGSVNGTFVDGQRVLDEYELPPACRIRIGRHTVLRFTAVDEQGREREYRRVITEERLRFEEEKSRALGEQAEELRRANADLETMASVVSTDLTQPLDEVVAAAGELEQRCADWLEDRDRASLATLTRAARRMRGLLDDLAAYARVGSEGAFEELDLAAIVVSAREDLDREFEDAAAILTADDLPRVTGDRLLLIRLFRSLLANAIKFRGADPPAIVISTAPEGGTWVVSVSDNGVGIAPEDASRVFQVFQRTRAADGQSGTGIGLAIAKKIVELHRGEIHIEPGEGPGTTVRFSLPAAFEPEG
ncbi:MAG: ATP-binding protein [Myxococcota bacterium]|nr:ATP-binding protein [Myxococcota bacterium]